MTNKAVLAILVLLAACASEPPQKDYYQPQKRGDGTAKHGAYALRDIQQAVIGCGVP